MMTVKVITNFSHYADGDLAITVTHIVDSLTGNAAYPTPSPSLTDVQTALDAYTTALGQTADGGVSNTVLKNQTRLTLEGLLTQLAYYVQANCKSDLATALSSSFPLVKTPAPVGVLNKPENLKAVPGIAGEIQLSVYTVPHAVAYLWQYRLVTDTAWTDIHTTKSRTSVQGLVSGQQYSFRVSGIGSNPTQNWSNEVQSFVL